MQRVLEHLRKDLGKRHAGSPRRGEDPQALRFHAMGRNGNWAVVMTVDEPCPERADDVLDIVSTLPLTVSRRQRAAVGELVACLNALADDGRFEGPDASGRVHCRGLHRIPADAVPSSLRLLVERHIALVDRHLPSFFAVVAGGQTPTEAVSQLERMRRFA
ncbi:hypothetical protein IGS68_12085 [Skermanella sp. TT6]|uniref:Uncharacterized protein n=1 Tax=Skermanella cutis TaxID=2775420 RepID=A0ABX7BE73_9PROT|nr:hypothetical protein [Skermanella sp. TT6]QQP91890.1 hypothetical protein IGS68_12085 [Skermanella sp. TT6]